MKLLKLFKSSTSATKSGRQLAQEHINEGKKIGHVHYQGLIKKAIKDVEADTVERLTSKDGLSIEWHDFSVGYLETLKKALDKMLK